MNIRIKILLSFVLIFVGLGFAGYFTVGNLSQQALQETIGEDSAAFAESVLSEIDRTISHRIEQVQICSGDVALESLFLESNKEFEEIDRNQSVQEYILEKDEEWVSAGKKEITPFMQEILNNKLSQEMKEEFELKEFYKQKYGFEVFSEAFVTNKYGANVAQTQKTSDYYQADEDWWQNAKRDGLYVEDVEYDESAEVYSLAICVRIEDEGGNFLGVIKVVLNMAEIINIVDAAAAAAAEKTAHFKLLTKEGKIIYATKEFELFEEVSEEILSGFGIGEEEVVDYFIAPGDEPGEGGELFAHAHSEGYKDFEGFGWILVVEHETEEIFAPVSELKNTILMLLIAVIGIAVVIAFIISRSISEPISRLRKTALEFGKGNLKARSEVKSRDEVEELSNAFNEMAGKLMQNTLELRSALKEAEGKARALREAKEARLSEKEIKKKAKELEDARLATMNILEDVSEARENIERMYGELKELDAMKDDFMNIAAHELKTPLIPVVGYVDMILKGSMGKVSEQQEKSLRIIQRNVQRLQELINDVLDISKLEGKAMKFEMKEIDLIELIKQTTADVKPFANEKKLFIKISLPKKMKPVKADGRRITQVLGNLIKNAVKFTEKGGSTVTAKEGKDSVWVSVKDTGIGIKPDGMKKLFTKFFQADISPARKAEGTGLGLAISKGILISHGGDIKVESGFGKGSTFTFTLPFKPPEKPSEAFAEVLEKETGKTRKLKGKEKVKKKKLKQ